MPDNGGKTILKPKIHESVFIAEGARIYGDVEIGQGANIWFNAVIRGDEGKIRIGKNTNVQDNVVIHSDGRQTEIGEMVTIGHGAVLRSCRIGSHVMVGMNATIMTGAEIGDHSIVGAHSFVAYDRKFPEKSLLMGVPAELVRKVTGAEEEYSRFASLIYQEHVVNYSRGVIASHDSSDSSKYVP